MTQLSTSLISRCQYSIGLHADSISATLAIYQIKMPICNGIPMSRTGKDFNHIVPQEGVWIAKDLAQISDFIDAAILDGYSPLSLSLVNDQENTKLPNRIEW